MAAGGDQELDLPGLREALADLGRQVQEAQARVIATVDAKHAEFVAASEQVADLRGAVSKLREELRRVAAALGQSASAADAHDAGRASLATASPVKRLRAAVAEHNALKEELAALDTFAVVMTTILEAQRRLTNLDGLIGAARYSDAAALTLEVAHALRSISAQDTAAEPAMVKATKLQYYQKRAILVSRIEDALLHLVSFAEGHSVIARQSTPTFAAEVRESAGPGVAKATTLQQVWDALEVLALRGRRVELLADTACAKVVAPLLDAARRLPVGRELRAGSDAAVEHGVVLWKWFEAECDDFDMENTDPEDNLPAKGAKALNGRLRPVQVVLPALESFFTFVFEHWTSGSQEVFGGLGKRLWPLVARALVQNFDTCQLDGGEALLQFEASMSRRGLIRPAEKTLSRHVHHHRRALGDQRRKTVLADARTWLMQETGALVDVSDAEEPGSVTQLLAQPPFQEPPAQAAPEVADSAVRESLRRALSEDSGLMRLPAMRVSGAVRQLVCRLRELMEEVVVAADQGQLEVAADASKLCRELCTLFAVLRPYSQKAQLKTDARSCAIFMTDCLYLVHVLILMPYTHGRRLPSDARHFAFFVDLVPELRRLGENHFFAMLRHQQEQIAAALRPCDLGPGISRDRTFIAAEAALGAAVQHAKLVAQGLACALPVELLKEISGMLVGMICQNLLGKLFALLHLAPEEVGCVTALFASALAMCRQVLAVAGVADSVRGSGAKLEDEDAVPGWFALTVASDLLGSGFQRFLERRAEFSKAFTRDEAVKLMQLSWRDEQISPEDAWPMLSAGGRG